MEILEYAMQMEKDGENFYREIASSTNDAGLKTITNMLADEEVKHYRLLQKMKADEYVMTETTILEDAKNVFSGMQGGKYVIDKKDDQIAVYREAQDIEKRSRLFYEEKAAETDNKDQKKLFERIAEEERKHYFLLENIIEFVSRPENWIENAEWNHLEAY
ncbi:MAG: ferritin family protein [Candidatus Krumholzibacteriota bacterium]|nr:ferritin family protein [Candidatus Krumholzibacteriota bacterium]